MAEPSTMYRLSNCILKPGTASAEEGAIASAAATIVINDKQTARFIQKPPRKLCPKRRQKPEARACRNARQPQVRAQYNTSQLLDGQPLQAMPTGRYCRTALAGLFHLRSTAAR